MEHCCIFWTVKKEFDTEIGELHGVKALSVLLRYPYEALQYSDHYVKKSDYCSMRAFKLNGW